MKIFIINNDGKQSQHFDNVDNDKNNIIIKITRNRMIKNQT